MECTGTLSVQIAVPGQDTVVALGTTLTLRAQGTDQCGDPVAGQDILWSSQLGSHGTGTTLERTFNESGLQVFVVTVGDNTGSVVTDTRQITVNAAPLIEITSPAIDVTLALGDSVDFEAFAIDQDDLAEPEVTWTCDRDGALGSGASITVHPPSVGVHVITAQATDAQGATAAASRTVTVEANQAPSATIVAPVPPDTSFVEDEPVTFRGTATDPEDGPLGLGHVQWISSVDGPFSSDTVRTYEFLSVGAHQIRFVATDAQGAADTASQWIVIMDDQHPVAAITAPASGATFQEEELVTLEGTGTDPEQGPLSGTDLRWWSSLDGFLGTGTPFATDSLSVGTHEIRLYVIDRQAQEDTAYIDLTITPQVIATDPTATITAPAPDTLVQVLESVTFEGTGTDPEDGTLSGASLVWSSSRRGALGTGSPLTVDSLAGGTHQISLVVTDSDGAADTAMQALIVNRPPVVTMTRPSGTLVIYTDTITLMAEATDPDGDPMPQWAWLETGPGGSRVPWNAGPKPALFDTLSPGLHRIQVFVGDDRYGVGEDSGYVEVRRPPVASIVSPSQDTTLTAGDTLFLVGYADDLEDGVLAGASVFWNVVETAQTSPGTTAAFALDVGTYTVIFQATDSDNQTAQDTVLVTVAAPLVSYLTFENAPILRYAWPGRDIAVLTERNDLSTTAMADLLDALDAAWSFYQDQTGISPAQGRSYNGRATVAQVSATCGAGCGFVGATGVEILDAYFNSMIAEISATDRYDQIPFYEFGRNFWFYTPQLEYKAPDATGIVTTGYAVYMRFVSMDSAGVAGVPYNGHTFASFRAEVEDLITTYLADPSHTFDTTLRVGQGVPNSMGLGATDLFASFLFRLARDYGGNGFTRALWHAVPTLPAAANTEEAVYNFIDAASIAAGQDLSPIFASWRWPTRP